MNIKLVFTSILAAVLLSACNNAKVTGKNENEMSNFEVIYESEYGGNGQEEIKIIENQDEFAELWAQTTMQPVESVPQIDFTKKIIIAKNFPSRNSGGTQYKVQSVSQNGNQIEIHYTATGPDGMATMAITNPLMIVAVNKVSDPQVNFVLQNK